MRHEFHPDARLEFRESAAFYEACRPGLGVAFANEIESVLRTIIGLPTDGRLSKRMFADVWPAVFHTAFFIPSRLTAFLLSRSCTAVGSPAIGAADSHENNRNIQQA
jgi:hypothetical protein